MLRPIGTLAMIRLMLHGAMGTLGEAQGAEHFEFRRLVVRPTLPQRRRGMKVTYGGEVARMRAPLEFHVLDKPLHLLIPQGPGGTQQVTVTYRATGARIAPDSNLS